jgi:HK97 family phage major capsid protein
VFQSDRHPKRKGVYAMSEVSSRTIDALPKGTSFARVCLSLALTGNVQSAAVFAEKRFTYGVARALRAAEIQKAAVAAGTTVDSTWAGALADFGGLVTQFLAALSPMTIVGRLTGMPRVPFARRFMLQTDTASGEWVGEGMPIPLAALSFNYASLAPTKVAIITAISDSIARFEGPAAESFMLNALLRSHARVLDASFIDPTNAGTTEVEPAAVTYGAPGLASTGATVAAVTSDLNSLGHMLADLGSDLLNTVWVMHPRTAVYLSTLAGSGGSPAFSGVGFDGGVLFRRPVLTSTSVPLNGSPATTSIALIDPSRILVADDGEVEVDKSTDAALQMLSNPTNDSATPTATTLVSMYHNNCVGVKSQRTINWQATTGAAALLTAVPY